MGSGMFAHLVPDMFSDTTGGLFPGRSGRGPQMGPNGSSYAGVAPSLAGANAGYGGPVQPLAAGNAGPTPINPYVYAARQATGQ